MFVNDVITMGQHRCTAAVNSLPARRREVLVLVRMFGLSRKDVAEVMDLAPQTVANHLKLAMDDLRGILAPYFYETIEESIEEWADVFA